MEKWSKSLENDTLALGLFIDMVNNEIFIDENEKKEYLEKIKWSGNAGIDKFIKKQGKNTKAYEEKSGTYGEFLKSYPNLNIINWKDLEYNTYQHISSKILTHDQLLKGINSKNFFDIEDKIWIVSEAISNILFNNYAINKT